MTVLDIADQHAQSVTRHDQVYRGVDERPDALGGVLHFYFPSAYGKTVTTLPMDLPPRWARTRDYILASTIDHNTMWAAAVGKAISKQVALGWTISDMGQSERRTKRYQQLLLNANQGDGWTSFLTQHLSDYLLTDNGAFVEVMYSTRRLRRDVRGQLAPVGRVLGIGHLDSARCTRLTDDDLFPYRDAIVERYGIWPEEVSAALFPVLYTDTLGRGHLLARWEVLDFVDMRSPRVELRGTGMCAASRAYHAIFKDTGMERYVAEKITGNRPLEIHLVNGIQAGQLEEGLRSADDQQKSRNLVAYKGVVVISATKLDANLSGYRIPIAEIPDGFDPQQERTNTYIKYANSLGIPVRDLEPAPAGLNSGQTAVMEAEAAEGVGLASWKKAFEHALNTWVLPETTAFGWAGTSRRDEKEQAEIAKTRADVYKVYVKDIGMITPAQALQLAADAGDVPPTMLADDETPQDELADDEKPLDDAAQAGADQDADGDGRVRLGDLLAGGAPRRRASAGEVPPPPPAATGGDRAPAAPATEAPQEPGGIESAKLSNIRLAVQSGLLDPEEARALLGLKPRTKARLHAPDVVIDDDVVAAANALLQEVRDGR